MASRAPLAMRRKFHRFGATGAICSGVVDDIELTCRTEGRDDGISP
jgi:hypothetical protein